MVSVDERRVLAKYVEYLKESLPYEIWYWRNYVLRAKGLFPRRPEIDLIICRKEKDVKVPPLFAAEVKYIRITKTNRVNPSYYSGLDEALALLILGFDKVMLIHLVEEKVLSTVFLDHAKLLSDTIKILKLPLGYRIYALTLSDDVYIYRTIRLRTGNTYNLEDLWVAAPPNPLLKDNSSLGETVRRNRRMLDNILGIKDA